MAWPVATRSTGDLVTAAIWNSDLVANLNSIINSSGNLAIAGTGPHALGTGVLSNVMFTIGGAFSGAAGSTTAGLLLSPSLTVAFEQIGVSALFSATLNESGSSNHPLFATVGINPPTIVNGGATTDLAATLWITGVPTGGSVNYAVLIDTGGDDNIHLAIRNTDVAHGFTGLVATNVYGLLRKASSADGGLSIQGYSDGVAGCQLFAFVNTPVATETGGSSGAVCLQGALRSGTGGTTMGADDNVVVFINHGNTTHIFKGNGDSYEDGTGWTAYDDEDDVALLEAVDVTLDKGLRSLRRHSAEFLRRNERQLERLKIVTFNRQRNGRCHPFINRSRLGMLHNGALRLAFRTISDLERRVAELEEAA